MVQVTSPAFKENAAKAKAATKAATAKTTVPVSPPKLQHAVTPPVDAKPDQPATLF